MHLLLPACEIPATLATVCARPQLLAANCTTIEMYEKDRIHPWPYNKGMKRNLEEVFGRK